jgi:hypothetical protein
MKLFAQFILALRDLALLSPKEIEMKLIERKVLEQTFVFDRTISPKWWKRLL